MLPIHDLLHRIQWDPDFSKAAFEIGYLDRVAGRVVRVPFGAVRVERGDRLVVEADGAQRTIPLHRVRAVWRNGNLIWRRDPEAPEPT